MRIKYLLLIISICLQSAAAVEEKDITQVMTNKIYNVVELLKDKSLEQKVKDQKIIDIVNPIFDFTLMAKLGLGKKQWLKLNKKEQNEFIDVFGKRIKDSYIEKINLYTDEGVKVEKAQKVKSSRIHLLSYLIMAEDKKEINYKFYKTKTGDWLVYDVDIFGVSIIQTYRSQLSGILEKESFEELLQRLRTPEK